MGVGILPLLPGVPFRWGGLTPFAIPGWPAIPAWRCAAAVAIACYTRVSGVQNTAVFKTYPLHVELLLLLVLLLFTQLLLAFPLEATEFLRCMDVTLLRGGFVCFAKCGGFLS